MKNPQDNLAAGQSVGGGRYLLEKPGDRPGLWCAQDEIEESPVVLKFLPRELRQDVRGVDQLRRAAEIAVELEHPGFGRVVEFFEGDDGPPFVAVSPSEGQTLTEWRKSFPGGTVPWGILEPIALQLLDTLRFGHAKLLFQGMVQPENVRIVEGKHLRIEEPGVWSVLNHPLYTGASPGATAALPYFSPQQIIGQAACAADDIYSFGSVIYDMVTGTAPFYHGEILPQVRNTRPESIERRQAELGLENPVPARISALIMACLEKEAPARPASIDRVEAVLRGVEKLSATVPAVVAPAAGTEATSLQARLAQQIQAANRRRTFRRRVVGVIAAVALIGAFAATWYSYDKSDEATRQAQALATKKYEDDLRQAEAIRRAGQEAEKQRQAEAAAAAAEKKRLADEAERKIKADMEAARRAGEEAARVKLAEEIARDRAALEAIQKKAQEEGARKPRENDSAGLQTIQDDGRTLGGPNEDGFVSIFNGTDLAGWEGDPAYWSVRDGTILVQSRPDSPTGLHTFLIWQKPVGDFELRFSFRMRVVRQNYNINSGVSYRAVRAEPFDLKGYQFEISMATNNVGTLIVDRARTQLARFGQKTIVTDQGGTDLVKIVAATCDIPVAMASFVRDDWNEGIIIVRGNRMVHLLNRHVIADVTDNNATARAMMGALGLELFTGNNPSMLIQFRNLQLREFSR